MRIFNLPCPHNDWEECRYCHSVTAQDGWRFKGCFCPPLNGKLIAEVEECPDKAQKGEQYINKAAVVAEIENWKQHTLKCGYAGQGEYEEGNKQGRLDTCEKILSFLNTLETKEADIEKELKLLDNTLFDLDGVAVQGATHYLTVEDVKDIAKHFYELGLKAQKVE